MRAAVVAIALVSFAATARANDAFLAAYGVAARESSGSVPEDAAAAFWETLPATTVPLAAQRSVHLNDRAANAAVGGPARSVAIRAAYNQRDLALLIEWSDDTQDRARPDETNLFGDSVAVELPMKFGAGVRLPYVGMGDEEQHVALYHARAGADGTIAREAVAAGFGSSTRAELGEARMQLRYDESHKRWRALLVRPLVAGASDLRQGLVPFAVAVWDGGRSERGGNKALSSWHFLRLERFPSSGDYLREVSWGFAPGESGDAARGKVLAEAMCAACHFIGDKRVTAPGLGPDLSSLGAIALPSYIRESILSPSAIIVPSPNLNGHYDRSAPRDANGAYPNNPLFAWYTRGQGGKKVSKMPPFTLSKEDVTAIVTYLRSLGRSP